MFGKAHLLAPTYGDELFRKAEWEDSSRSISWRDTYWNALEDDYLRYKARYNDETPRPSQSARARSAGKDIDSLINRNRTEDNRTEMDEFAWYKRNCMFDCINLCINLEDLTCVSAPFDYPADLSLLDQWKTLEKRIPTMARLARDILAAAPAGVSCEELFSIASRQYASHKFYNPATMRALMILRHHDIRENILELFHADLEEDSTSHPEDLLYEQEERDQAMQDAMGRQYMDDDEDTSLNITVSSMFIYLNSNLVNI